MGPDRNTVLLPLGADVDTKRTVLFLHLKDAPSLPAAGAQARKKFIEERQPARPDRIDSRRGDAVPGQNRGNRIQGGHGGNLRLDRAGTWSGPM